MPNGSLWLRGIEDSSWYHCEVILPFGRIVSNRAYVQFLSNLINDSLRININECISQPV